MRKLVILDVVLTAGTLLAVPSFAQERTIKRAELPAAVQQALVKQTEGATIRSLSVEKENGQAFYEAALTVNGHTKDISMDGAGNVAEVEEEIAFDSLPTTVKDGLRSKAGNGKIVKVESLTKHHKLVAYEAKVIKEGKKSEVQVGPQGQPLDHEE
jgi:hypothetical protein